MKEIPLTKGKVALVDDADYDALMVRSWCYDKGYAWAKIDGRKQSMHRWLLGGPEGLEIDHINSNGCDNRRQNLRTATRAQNNHNRHRFPKNKRTSRFKGVCFHNKKDPPWRAQMTIDNKTVHIGYYDTEEKAARAYDAAAKKQFGEFAKPNFENGQ